MNTNEVFRISWEAIGKNKVRSLLTMLGIIIGVAAVIIMIAISAGTEATISDQITSLGTNLIFVSSSFTRMGPGMSSGTELVYNDATAIAETTGVTGVVVEQDASETVKAGDISVSSISISGTSPDFLTVRDLTVAKGRFFTAEDVTNKKKVIVLGSKLAVELFGTADPTGQSVLVSNTRLTVIGVMAEKGTVGEVDYDTRAYIPISVMLQKFAVSPFSRIKGDTIRMVFVQVDPKANMDNVILQIKILLAKRHNVTLASDSFTITTQQDIIKTQ
jgi:putative ABC transport system permease protein